MALFKPPIGTSVPIAENSSLLNGKSEDQLSVSNADTIDNLDASEFATINHTHTGYVATSDYEDLDVLNKIKNVDGYESGLDADLWQGYTPQNITISNASNATQLNGEYSYAYKNVIKFQYIANTPPETPYSDLTIMVGTSPSGGFAGFPFGTIVRYNGSSWDVIGNA